MRSEWYVTYCHNSELGTALVSTMLADVNWDTLTSEESKNSRGSFVLELGIRWHQVKTIYTSLRSWRDSRAERSRLFFLAPHVKFLSSPISTRFALTVSIPKQKHSCTISRQLRGIRIYTDKITSAIFPCLFYTDRITSLLIIGEIFVWYMIT